MAGIVTNPEDTLKNFKIDSGILAPSDEERRAEAYADAVEHDSTEVEPLSDAEAKALYEEAAAINAAIETLTERREAIKAIYRRLDYGTTTVHAESKGAVTVGHNPIFNEAKFYLDYPYDYSEVEKVVVPGKGPLGRDKIEEQVVYPNRVYYKTGPDRAALKKLLSKEDYAALFDEGDKKITIK